MEIMGIKTDIIRIKMQNGVTENTGVGRSRANGTREVTGVITVKRVKNMGPKKRTGCPQGGREVRRYPSTAE